ncbi:hypothetical protein PR003_g4087 [Phytophthora rubi]|uniref:Uncharacterized protein n=1 Tax=Phytophthora rubi TaxID=129364 RepID=A0A6A4G6T3_9STRA|nr:hypothetical protein PR003_g4087 [Phytophthora rubi]
MLELIEHRKMNDSAYKGIMEKRRTAHNISGRKQIQCPFRLVDIIFSDASAGRYDALGGSRSREDLDSAVSAENVFWVGVAIAFADVAIIEFGQLCYQDIHPALDRCGISPVVIVLHDAASLLAMWTKLKSDYAAPAAKFKLSGHHSQVFFGYCGGRLDLLYLKFSLDAGPELTNAIEQPLPKRSVLREHKFW